MASLSSEGGKKFYSSVLHDDAIMLFQVACLYRTAGVLESLNAQPWKFQIEEPVISLSEECLYTELLHNAKVVIHSCSL